MDSSCSPAISQAGFPSNGDRKYRKKELKAGRIPVCGYEAAAFLRCGLNWFQLVPLPRQAATRSLRRKGQYPGCLPIDIPAMDHLNGCGQGESKWFPLKPPIENQRFSEGIVGRLLSNGIRSGKTILPCAQNKAIHIGSGFRPGKKPYTPKQVKWGSPSLKNVLPWL